MRKITELIIHHSGSPVHSHDNIQTISRWHNERGFKGCGYHFYIDMMGMINYGRPLSVMGAHCKGHNKESIGICCGGLHGLTPYQRKSLTMLSMDMVRVFNIKKENVFLHKDLANTECPNFDINWLKFKIFKENK